MDDAEEPKRVDLEDIVRRVDVGLRLAYWALGISIGATITAAVPIATAAIVIYRTQGEQARDLDEHGRRLLMLESMQQGDNTAWQRVSRVEAQVDAMRDSVDQLRIELRDGIRALKDAK
jgi:hypothetical protein